MVTSIVHDPLDIEKIRDDFPALKQKIYGKPLVYLDNAATTQKPEAVLNAMSHYSALINANVHRGVHFLSEQATAAFEEARRIIQRHLNASSPAEVIFVRGATEAINLVAQSYGRTFLKQGDEVIISWMEHHSNIVPWQLLRDQTGIVLRAVPISDRGELLVEEYEKMLSSRTKIVAFTHISNALGTVLPVKDLIRKAHAAGAVTLIDGAQAVPHMLVDVNDLDCDFYTFSGHKTYGPTGIGILYGKRSLLEKMPPYQGGGEMISSVSFEKTIYNEVPHKFEAGTPHISGAIALGTALQYLQAIGFEHISAHESQLLKRATHVIGSIPGVRLIGTAERKAGILSFTVEGIHPHDLGTILDREGIAVRAGHHCAMPVMQRFDLAATARASFALYNTEEEIDRLAAGIQSAKRIFTV